MGTPSVSEPTVNHQADAAPENKPATNVVAREQRRYNASKGTPRSAQLRSFAPIELTEGEISSYGADRFPHVKQTRATEWRGPCPVHDGKDDNFAVNSETGACYCHSVCGRGWDIIGLEMELTGAGFKEAKAEVFRIIGRPEELPFSARIETTYDYTDEDGNLLYQVLRLHSPKGFMQRRPNGSGGWIWKKNPRQVLYHLREVIDAPTVFVVEGEKDVETLRSHGFVATTNAGGAKAAWLPTYTETLAGKEVILIPDNDEPGRDRVAQILRAVVGQAARLIVVELPGVKDVSDWFAAEHSELELIALVEGDDNEATT